MIQYNVGREPRWDQYEALHAKSGRPLVWTALLAGSLGPNSHRQQLARAGEQIARGLPLIRRAPAARSRSSSISMRRSCSTPGRRLPTRARRPTTCAAQASMPTALPARVKRQADGRGQTTPRSWARGAKETPAALPSGTSPSPFEGFDAAARVSSPRSLQGRRCPRVDLMLDLALEDREDGMRAAQLNFVEAEVREIVQGSQCRDRPGRRRRAQSQSADAAREPCLLGHWVREDGALTLEQAVHRLTGATASLFGLARPRPAGRGATGRHRRVRSGDRRRARAGAVNDLPADGPIAHPRGIHAVIVNGGLLPPPGELADRPAGRLLRQRRAA